MTSPTDTTGGRVLSDDDLMVLVRVDMERRGRSSAATRSAVSDLLPLVRAVESAVLATLAATPLDVEAMAFQVLVAVKQAGRSETSSRTEPIAAAIRHALATQAAQLKAAEARVRELLAACWRAGNAMHGNADLFDERRAVLDAATKEPT